MTVDFRAEVDKRKDAMMDDLFALLRINSERDDSQADSKHPLGPGPVIALEHFLAMAERDGDKIRNIDNYAGDFEFGEGDEVLGIFAHVDVVPAGSGWDTDPFEPVIKDGKLYARGSSDDKGSTMAAYYALKMIYDLELPVSKLVRVIIGTDEESEWSCMDHYLYVAETPDFGFSPDAYFPIINGEKGNMTVNLTFKGENGADYMLISFEAGLRPNMVPQDAEAIVEVENAEVIAQRFEDFLDNQPVTRSVEIKGNELTFNVVGKAAHGSTPENGVNAATYLATFLNEFAFEKDAKAFLNVAATYLHESHEGEKLGIAYEDELMGKLSSNFGIFNFEEGTGGQISANMRYPQGTDEETIFAQFEETLADEAVKCVLEEGGKVPHYVPKDDPLVHTLLDVYRRQTGQ